jgi:hypothetical protein
LVHILTVLAAVVAPATAQMPSQHSLVAIEPLLSFNVVDAILPASLMPTATNNGQPPAHFPRSDQ